MGISSSTESGTGTSGERENLQISPKLPPRSDEAGLLTELQQRGQKGG